MLQIWTALQNRFTDEEGASLVEYALLVALIAIVGRHHSRRNFRLRELQRDRN